MPAVGEIYQMTYQMRVAGQLCENVLHFRTLTGSETRAQIRTSAEFYLTTIAPGIASPVTFESIIIKQMTPLAFDETIGPPVTTTSGSSAAQPINNTTALVITKRTGVAGKTHRGRIYIAGIPATQADPNGLNTAGAAIWHTIVGNLMATYGDSGTDLNLRIGVYSGSIGGFHPFTVAGWQQLTGLDVQPVFGNQRRRRLGVGI